MWEEMESFREGRVAASLQRAEGDRGPLYSVRFGKDNPRSPSGMSSFIDPRDLGELRVLVDQIEDYMADMKAQQQLPFHGMDITADPSRQPHYADRNGRRDRRREKRGRV